MTPIRFSSGDLLADRRADYAEMLFQAGDHAAAADLLGDALSLADGWIAGWYRLGEMREAAGDFARAADAWRCVLRLDAEDRFGASLRLGLIGAAHGLDQAPSAFVETLFDQYADRFDEALLEGLDYRVPELLSAALRDAGRESFAHTLDLGCGTGLMGERMRSRTSFLEGIDISGAMLRKARAKGVYDRLEKRDLHLLEGIVGNRADLVLAADVFMYVGALERVFAAVATRIAAGGLFAFSVERAPESETMVLRESRRFAHSATYLRRVLDDTGFHLLRIDPATIRMDRGLPVEGWIVLAERAGQAAVDATAAKDESFDPPSVAR